MFFFDFALMTIVGAGAVAAGIGAVALVTAFLNRHRSAVEGDCRDTEWILHGEGHRDC
jgi:hypothetical protein